MKKPPPIWNTELVPWKYVARHSKKGWLTRDFNIGGVWYRWLSNGVSTEGLMRYGIREPISQ